MCAGANNVSDIVTSLPQRTKGSNEHKTCTHTHTHTCMHAHISMQKLVTTEHDYFSQLLFFLNPTKCCAVNQSVSDSVN